MAEPARITPLRPIDGDLPATIELRLVVTDRDMVEDLVHAREGDERDRLGLQALRIGLLALRQARGRIDADTVRHEGERILGDLQSRLGQHGDHLQSEVRRALQDYFDPKSGRFTERVERLVRKDGELEEALRRQIGAKDSELARTLSAHVGESSPLLRLLSPTQSDGVIQSLGRTVEDALKTQRERILAQFSLDAPESALSRLVTEMEKRYGKLGTDLSARIDDVVGEFSLDTEGSALSRLVRQVDSAQQTITREFDLNEQGSSLARLRGELLSVIEKQTVAATAFQQEVKSALSAMTARKEEAAKSTRHGLVFEDDVYAFVEKRSLALGDIPSRVGGTTGLVRASKVGDAVVTLGADRFAAGATIVVEAKQRAGCDVSSAFAESEIARKNRGAQACVFVMSRRLAPDGFPALLRRGADIVVIWDPQESSSDVRLDAALSVAEAICTKAAAEASHSVREFESLDWAVNEVERQVRTLDEMKTSAETITGAAGKIVDRIAVVRRALEHQISELRAGLDDLRRA
jgi:hypothetical protein